MPKKRSAAPRVDFDVRGAFEKVDVTVTRIERRLENVEFLLAQVDRRLTHLETSYVRPEESATFQASRFTPRVQFALKAAAAVLRRCGVDLSEVGFRPLGGGPLVRVRL